MYINRLAINQSVTVVVFLALLVVVGTYCYVTLPREAAPEVIVPIVNVTTTYQGVAPEDMESLVTIPIERKLTGISGVKEIQSASIEGLSNVTIEFVANTDIDDALQKVRDKVDMAKPDIPEEADDPVITELNISELPVMTLSLTGAVGLAALNKIAEDFEDRLETIKGVLDVKIIGGLEREIEIEVDPERVARYGVSLSELAALTRMENVNTPSGALEVGEAKYLVRVPGEFKTPDELTSLVVKRGPSGIVYLRDIANIRDKYKEPETMARLNGTPCIHLTISKRTGENIIHMADEVYRVVDEMGKKLPPIVRAEVTLDQSEFVRDMVSELENGILSGLILVVGVIFVFMGITNAVFIAVAIPISMLITFVVLQMMGVTLNFVVLFSLILALGNLVDVSIVVIENTWRHMQMGVPRKEAAYRGAAEVGWPILGSTMTTVAGFFPLLFWPGVMGDFMSYLPQTVSISLLASLFVGMVVNPAIASLWMPTPKKKIVTAEGKIRRGPLLRFYGGVLRVALRWRWVTTTVFVMVLLSITAIFIVGAKVEFMPETEAREAHVDIDLPQGTNLETSDEYLRQAEKAIAPDADKVKFVIANVGSRGVDLFGGPSGTHQNRITVQFPKLELCKELPSKVIARIRQAVGRPAGATVRLKKEEHGPPTGPPVNIEISGDDFAVLAKLGEDIKRAIKDIPNLVDLDDNYDSGKPEVRVKVDRQRAYLAGLNTQFVGMTVKAAINGMKAGDYREGDDEYDVTVRFPKSFREDLSNIESMNLINVMGTPVPFSAVAKVEHGGGLGSINRINRKRTITISGDVDGRLATEVLADVQKRLSTFPLPAGYLISYTGENEDQQESQDFLMRAFVVALFLITLVMVAEFNSILQPLIIMSTVILSLSGVFLSLVVLDMPFDVIMTGVAVISLAGVVVNNGIVLLDFINVLIGQGMPVTDAIVEAGMTRFRPVMMTAITTVIGLVPMAIGVSFDFRRWVWIVGGESAQWWGPMAIAVIFGLMFATLLTLIVVPTLYSFYASFVGLFRRVPSVKASVSEPIPAE